MRLRLTTCYLRTLWLLLIASAWCTSAALCSDGLSWVAWLSLLPLFAGIRALPPDRAAAAGTFWGVCLYLFTTTATNSPIPASLPNLLLLAIFPAVYATLGSVFTRRFGFSPLAMGVGWIGLELALQPLGLGHSLLATGSGASSMAFLIADTLGYGIVAFLVAYAVACLLLVATVIHRQCSSKRLFRYSRSRTQYVLASSYSPLSTIVLQPSQPRAPPFLRTL